jgi:hypothetical protein
MGHRLDVPGHCKKMTTMSHNEKAFGYLVELGSP